MGALTDPCPISPSSDSQPALPYEVLHIVLEYYIAARAHEVEISRPRLGSQYPVLPILTSSKWFLQTTIPLLYADVLIKRNSTLMHFLCDPHISSYRHLEKLQIENVVEMTPRIAEITDKRAIQMMLMTTTIDHASQDLASSLIRFFAMLGDRWMEHRPRVNQVHLRGGTDYGLAASLCSMFSIEHLVIDGYLLHDMLFIPLGFQHQSITLRCRPSTIPVDSVRIVKIPLYKKHGHPSKCLLKIGWGSETQQDRYSLREIKRAWDLIYLIARKFAFAGNAVNHFIISPYLGKDGKDHSFCLGQLPPTLNLSSEASPRVEFRSDCSCGNGDVTKFWEPPAMRTWEEIFDVV